VSQVSEGPLQTKLRESALVVLRRHGVSEEELQFHGPKPGAPAFCEISGHRIRIHLDEERATFHARGGRWSAGRADYPSTGSFVADFEEQLDRALSGRWR